MSCRHEHCTLNEDLKISVDGGYDIIAMARGQCPGCDTDVEVVYELRDGPQSVKPGYGFSDGDTIRVDKSAPSTVTVTTGGSSPFGGTFRFERTDILAR